MLASLATFAQKNVSEKDEFVGFYKGEFRIAGGKEFHQVYPPNHYNELYAEVYRGPNNKYRLRIQPMIMARAENFAFADNLEAKDGKIEYKAEGLLPFKGVITPTEITGNVVCRKIDTYIKLKRLDFKSPTMGLKAPENAVILFDGKDASKEFVIAKSPDTPVFWTIKDGAMTVKSDVKRPDGKRLSGTIRTKRAFGKCRVHLEFRTPPMYEKMGQFRANSGIIFGPYEVQLLDSFGTDALWNECGSLYRQTPPQVNACLEPGAWQTFDIYYTPAQFDGDKLIKDALFTVYQNGKRVQYETPVPFSTSMELKNAHKFKHPKTPVKIDIQDHLDPISFRNIWVEELK